jgi:hypothetical protein
MPLFVSAFRALVLARANLVAENLAVRQQLAVFKERHPRPHLRPAGRAFWMLLRTVWPRWIDAMIIATRRRRELLDHVVVLGERHQIRLLASYVSYHHLDRCHLGLGKDAPLGRPVTPRPSPEARVIALPRVGGVHYRYEWRMAA